MKSDEPKSNNCNIIFLCDKPKDCVHYKKKKVPKPCRTCEGYKKGKRWPYVTECHACFAYEEYVEKKVYCFHSGSNGKWCFNQVAWAQAMSVLSKQMGLEGFSTKKKEVKR